MASSGAKPADPISLLGFGRKVTWAGDSITNGSASSNATYAFPSQCVRIAGSAYLRTLDIKGVPGNTSAQLLARMDDVLANHPDHVHIAIGTNDASQAVTTATYAANIAAIVAACRKVGATIS